MSNIKATRNKEGVVEIGIEESGYHFIDFSDDGKYLFIKKWQEVEFEKILISNLEYYNPNEPIYFQWGNVPVKRIFIRNEPKITGQKVEKYMPSHEELLEMGFNTFNLLKNPPTPYWERINNLYSYTWFPISNLLFRDSVEIPFHTKEEFMKAVGVDETFGDKINDINLKLCELKSQMLTMLSDAKIELIKKLFSRES